MHFSTSHATVARLAEEVAVGDSDLQEVVNGRWVCVKRIPGAARVAIFVDVPFALFDPPYINVQSYLDEGLNDREVLERAMELAATTVRVAFKSV
ncbi:MULTISPECIES: hypothetical protein [Burkholderia]|uniref:hypothetical protein n=1 Tax=Burkholderia TaxID=32008 RepID=UPI000D41F52C|nr:MULTISPECIES: hypothetical protein [Burkholderia]MBU9381321.1 hypothetical protein [Burkholderia gladioli]MBU9424472.1 hypothetical protein [Burkholderia gladioli]MDN8061531.1 hypothetical protein [Burkholderia gladioli]PRG49689.1 hypothetical protein C6V06_23510 [Burkholderia gladioli]QKM48037.1 hypothetical protein B7760_02071 [Burkholderia glumae]